MSAQQPATSGLPEVLISTEDLQARVAELGRDIAENYRGRDLLLVTVLKGGLMFMADLCRAIDLPLALDFMAISSYGPGERGGAVRITKDLDEDIRGRAVLVVEDIIDTGLTLNYLLGALRTREPASLEVCVLLDRDSLRIADLPIAYRGFRAPDRFLVGYGLDVRQRLRNLPYLGVLSEEELPR